MTRPQPVFVHSSLRDNRDRAVEEPDEQVEQKEEPSSQHSSPVLVDGDGGNARIGSLVHLVRKEDDEDVGEGHPRTRDRRGKTKFGRRTKSGSRMMRGFWKRIYDEYGSKLDKKALVDVRHKLRDFLREQPADSLDPEELDYISRHVPGTRLGWSTVKGRKVYDLFFEEESMVSDGDDNLDYLKLVFGDVEEVSGRFPLFSIPEREISGRSPILPPADIIFMKGTSVVGRGALLNGSLLTIRHVVEGSDTVICNGVKPLGFDAKEWVAVDELKDGIMLYETKHFGSVKPCKLGVIKAGQVLLQKDGKSHIGAIGDQVDGEGFVKHDLWTQPGYSGSPILSADGKLVAIHWGSSGTSLNKAAPIHPKVRQLIQSPSVVRKN